MKATDITCKSCSVITVSNGGNHRKAYINSLFGRAEFISECADCENYSEVMAVWGNEPTVVEEANIEQTDTTPTIQDQIDANASAIAELAEIIAGGAS